MDDRRITRAIGVAVVLIILVMILRPLCAPEVVVPPDANQGAMKVAEDAVALARNANDEAAAFRNAVDRWYFVSLVLGVMIPVVVAFLLFKHWSQAQPEDAEVFRQLDQLREDEAGRLALGNRLSIDGEEKTCDLSARLPDEG